MFLYMSDVPGCCPSVMPVARDEKPMETMDDMAGLMRERPGLALAMTAFAISALGFPPFSGFWAKFYVFKAILAAGYVNHAMPVGLAVSVAVVGLVSSVVAAFY